MRLEAMILRKLNEKQLRRSIQAAASYRIKPSRHFLNTCYMH